jgi:hypothetical protein
MVAVLALSVVLAAAPVLEDESCSDLRPAVEAIAVALETRYVIPVRGAEAAGQLRGATIRSDFSHVCGGGSVQAMALSRATRAALNDLHLRVAYGPPESTTLPSQPNAAALADNLGIEEVSRMPGGIGYLRLSGWAPAPWVGSRLENAFALLRGSTGVIIDVRGNRGGDGDTVNLVTRTFLAEGAPQTLQTFDRAGERIDWQENLDPAWARFPLDIPLVVLVDRESFSGSEAFAFSLREEGRATIIGSRTSGAAHGVRDAVALPGGFALYIPEYRKEGRLTHTDWEGVGVRPDIDAGLTDAKMLAWAFLRERHDEKQERSDSHE